jgi:mRNA interferase HigB
VRIIAKRTLREFWEKHADCEEPLRIWYSQVEEADWRTPNDVKQDYASASILLDNRVVFNIKGNRYRLIVRINYDYGILWIRFVGTHAEYDKVDATEI